MKYQHRLSINGGIEQPNALHFQYGRSSPVCLSFTETNAFLSAVLTKPYADAFENSYAQNLIMEGIKRLSLAYFLTYARTLPIEECRLTIESQNGVIWDKKRVNIPKLYSFLDGVMGGYALPESWADRSVLQNVIGKMKTCLGAETAALYAYLISKTKAMEMERFLNLWMAVNGMYNHLLSDKTIKRDACKIQSLADRYFPHSLTIGTKDAREKIGKKIVIVLNNDRSPVTRDTLLDSHNAVTKKIGEILLEHKVELKDRTVYVYMLLEFSYFLRCCFFHADKPMPLYAYENDMDLRALKVAGDLVEDFLDSHLKDCFQ